MPYLPWNGDCTILKTVNGCIRTDAVIKLYGNMTVIIHFNDGCFLSVVHYFLLSDIIIQFCANSGDKSDISQIEIGITDMFSDISGIESYGKVIGFFSADNGSHMTITHHFRFSDMFIHSFS